MGGDGRGLRLLLALCTWVMLKANPLDFNGVDHYFQFILCSNDEWILAGSANLRVPSEIKSDKKKKKCDKGNGIYLLSWMQGVKQVYGSCDGRRQETNFFFFQGRENKWLETGREEGMWGLSEQSEIVWSCPVVCHLTIWAFGKLKPHWGA